MARGLYRQPPRPQARRPFVFGPPDLTQNLSLGLITQTAATFTPTITPGAAALTIGLLSQPAATFTPTVTATVNVSLGLISQVASPSSPTIAAGAAPVTFGLLGNTAATFTPTVSAQSAISVGLISQPAATFAPTATASVYANAVLADSPAAYWRLGEASGTTAVDITGNGHTGTYTGSPTLGTAGLLTGDSNTAVDFVISSYVQLTDHVNLRPGTAYTVEFWVKRNSIADNTNFYSKTTNGNFYGMADGTLRVGNDNGTVTRSTATTLSDTNRHHVVVTYAGTGAGNTLIYLDGVESHADGGQIGTGLASSTTAPRIGGYAGGGESSLAIIDEVAVYNAVLSAARVTAHYDAGGGTKALSLGLISQPAATFAPTVATGAAGQDASVGLISQTAATFAPTVTSLATVSLGLTSQTAATFVPTITSVVNVSLALVDQTAQTFAPTVATGAVSVALDFIDQSAVANEPVISTGAGQVVLDTVYQTAATFTPSVIAPPTWTTPADTVSIVAAPELKFLIPAMDGPVHFNLQLDTANTFATGDLRDIKSSADQTGWDFWNGSGWEAVTGAGVSAIYAGNEARYTVQTDLTPVTWYRRVRAGV